MEHIWILVFFISLAVGLLAIFYSFQLYKTYNKATPVIKEMITGKVVKTPHGTYRLKLRGGEHTETSPAQPLNSN